MTRSLLVLGMCSLVVTFGCKSASHRGGEAPSEQGFKIVGPRSVDLRQGETKAVAIRLNRGNFFKQDVRIATQVSNQGVSVEPMEATVRADQPADVQVRVAAAADAALGRYRVTVTGTPESGTPTSVSFPVSVNAP